MARSRTFLALPLVLVALMGGGGASAGADGGALRPERDRLRPEHAGGPDPGDHRRDPRAAGRRRDGHEPLRAPVPAGRLRQRGAAAAAEGGLLHRAGRPGRVPGGRDDQRQDRGLQPLPRRRGHEQLRRARQLLAHALEPVAAHRRGRPGRLPRVRELLGGLAGGVDAPARRQRREPLAHGLLHRRAAVRERRLHRRLEPAVRDQRLAAAVADPQQPDRRLVERGLEPGLRGRRGRPVGRDLPEPAVHDARDHARQPREAVPLRRRAGRLPGARARGADEHPRHLRGQTGPTPGRTIPLDDFFVATPADSAQTHQQPARARQAPAAHARASTTSTGASTSSAPTRSCSASGTRRSPRSAARRR